MIGKNTMPILKNIFLISLILFIGVTIIVNNKVNMEKTLFVNKTKEVTPEITTTTLTDVKTFNVTFMFGNGSSNLVKVIEEGKPVGFIENPVRSGYMFTGWYANYKPFSLSTIIVKDTKVTARWKKIVEPSAPIITVNDSWTNASIVPGQIDGSVDSKSAIMKYEYKMSGATKTEWTIGTSFTVVNKGITYIYARATNAEGKISPSSKKIVKIDRLSPTCTSKKYKYADLNNNGKIDSADITLITNHINGVKKLNKIQLYQADISNGNDAVDTNDLEAVKKALANNTNFDYYGLIVDVKGKDSGGSGIASGSGVFRASLSKAFIVIDKAGNTGTCSVSLTTVKTTPNIPTLSVNENWTNATSVNGTIYVDSTSETLGYEYSMSGATTMAWTSGKMFSVTNPGLTTVSARTVNVSGIKSPIMSKVVKIDRIAPTCSINKFRFGDPNNNGEIDLMDLALVIDHINGTKPLNKAQLYQADVANGNNAVDKNDLTAIQQAIVDGKNFDYYGIIVNVVATDVGGSDVESGGGIFRTSLSKTFTVKDKAGNTGTCLAETNIVKPIPVTGVNITGCELGTLKLGSGVTKLLSAIVSPTTASNKTVSWSNSNPSVVAITAQSTNGKLNGNYSIWALAAGESIVRVKTEDGGKIKECRIYVTNTPTTTTPTAPVINVNENWTNTLSVSGTISGSISYVRYEYSMSGATTIGWTAGTTFYVKNSGQTTIMARAVSKDGKISPITSKIVKIDRIAPTCTTTKNVNGDPNLVTVNVIEAGGSGIASGMGTFRVTASRSFTVKDKAGNTGTCSVIIR